MPAARKNIFCSRSLYHQTQDNSEQYFDTQDAYSAEVAHEEEYATEEQDQADSDNFDEDDQDNYM